MPSVGEYISGLPPALAEAAAAIRELCDRHLEGARPIDPNPVRVLVDPRFEQGEEALRGRLAVVEVVTLGEPDQMVMPAELPDALHIATADPVQVRDARPVQPRRQSA